MTEAQAALDALVRALEVRQTSEDLFVGDNPQGGGRLFGGLVAAQATVAAGRTVTQAHLHSLHAYFLRPGRPQVPIEYRVQRMKEGKNFRARHVTATQGDDLIFTLMASFTHPEDGISHQAPMPSAPGPEESSDMFKGLRPRQRQFFRSGIEMRAAEPADLGPTRSRRVLWMRPDGILPEDPLMHQALIVYASDRSLVMTGAMPHMGTRRHAGGASLDHAMWFHRQTPFSDWMMYAMESPVAHHARAWIQGAIYKRDGTQVATVTQEGLLRTLPAST